MGEIMNSPKESEIRCSNKVRISCPTYGPANESPKISQTTQIPQFILYHYSSLLYGIMYQFNSHFQSSVAFLTIPSLQHNIFFVLRRCHARKLFYIITAEIDT